MNTNTINSRFLTIAGVILLAVFSRFVPHPPNFSPMTAIALFSGAYFGRKYAAFVVPFAAMLLSDTLLELTTGWGFYPDMVFTYTAFALIVLLGSMLNGKISVSSVAFSGLAGSVSFFLLTNFGVWLMGSMYAPTAEGLVQSYTLALPFFRNALQGDIFYVTLLFGGFVLAERTIPALRKI